MSALMLLAAMIWIILPSLKMVCFELASLLDRFRRLDMISTVSQRLAKERQTFAVSLDDDDEDNPAFLQMPEKEMQETWYPSLRSTLWVLSLVHTYVEVRDLTHTRRNRL